MTDQELCVHSRVYTDIFRNKPYTMSMRENIEVTTPELTEQDGGYSGYYEEAISRYRARIDKEKAMRNEGQSR